MKIIFAFVFLIISSQFVSAQTKIDAYGKIISDDESGHLEHSASEFQQNPNSKLYILMNKEKSMPTDKFLRHFYSVENYLMLLGVPKQSLTLIAGEEKDIFFTEIWLVKKGEKTPDFVSVSHKELLNKKFAKKTLIDTDCIDCDPVVFINQFIFREGIDYLASVLKATPNSIGLLKIARVQYLSQTSREKRELTNQITDRLKRDGVEKNRISIRFTSGMSADFYIVPKMVKNRKK